MLYAEMVGRLFTTNGEPTREHLDLLHASIGLATEIGELLDTVKKNWIYDSEIDIVNVIEELGDVEFYLEAFRQTLGIKRIQTLNANKKKLAVRYKGMNFSQEQARYRRDKQGELGV